MPLISVVVIAYNMENYLKKCLDSLANQTLKDIEIIVVNDGSTDETENIMKLYTKKFKNIKGFTKENGGISSARNYGISKATGQYIAFLDSDDYVEVDMYEKMCSKAKNGNFDVVVCNHTLVGESGEKLGRGSANIKNDLLTKEEVKNFALEISTMPWDKIYKRELLENVWFRDIWSEDVDFAMKLFPLYESIGVVDDYMVNYLQRDGSACRVSDERIYDYFDICSGVWKYYQDNGYYEEYAKQVEYFYVKSLVVVFMKKAAELPCRDEYKKAYEMVKKTLREVAPKYRWNKFFYKSAKGIFMVICNSLLLNIVIPWKKPKEVEK